MYEITLKSNQICGYIILFRSFGHTVFQMAIEQQTRIDSIARDIIKLYYLSRVPASSADIERCFSAAALTLNAKRSRLKLDKLEELLFVKRNQPLINK